MIRITKGSTFSLLSTCSLAVVLAGCANSGSVEPMTQQGAAAAVTPAVVKGASGRLMGGQQPVAGVAVQLYAVGATGYGSAATPLLGSPVITGGSGNFTLPATYCPTSGNTNPYIYLVGTGGTPVGGSPNANIALMATLGPCQSIQGNSSLFISVNELTTVAAVWSLSPFMGTSCPAAVGYACIGSSATNGTGIVNAFSTASNLVSSSTGAVVVPNAATTNVIAAETITELADIVADCINSAGGSASDASSNYSAGTECGKLFYLTTSSAVTPTDTITAAYNLARVPATTNPSSYLGLLHGLALNSTAYSGRLSSAPTDYTVAVKYTGGGLNTPSALALDGSGNVWVTNSAGNSVTMLTNTGVASGPLTAAGQISGPVAVAVDPSNNVWVANSNSSITELTSGGASGNNYTGNGLATPSSIAIDGAGDVWVADQTGGLSGFNNSGAPLALSPYSGGGVDAPVSVAISSK